MLHLFREYQFLYDLVKIIHLSTLTIYSIQPLFDFTKITEQAGYLLEILHFASNGFDSKLGFSLLKIFSILSSNVTTSSTSATLSVASHSQAIPNRICTGI